MPYGRRSAAGLILALWFACATQALAAEISIERSNLSSAALVAIDGTLVPEDVDQLHEMAADIKNGTVVFRGEGGSVLAAIRIGKYIRLKNWISLVPAETTCSSACALAWLGGTRRFANPTARIGFYAAHVTKGGEVTETNLDNAIVRSYLNELGFSKKAVAYIMSSDLRSMRWLTADDAPTLGIKMLPGHSAQPLSSEPPHSALSNRPPTTLRRDFVPLHVRKRF